MHFRHFKFLRLWGILFLLHAPLSPFAQTLGDTLFFDSVKQLCLKNKAETYRINTAYSPNDSLFAFEIYTIEHQLKKKGFSRDVLEQKLEGPLEVYYRNGKIEKRESYKNNRLLGESKLWYANGQLKTILQWIKSENEKDKSYAYIQENFDSLGNQMVKNGHGVYLEISGKSKAQGPVVDGFKHGLWEGFQEHCDVFYTETYENGELVGGQSRFENKTFNYTRVFVNPAAIEAQQLDLMRFIAKNVDYPEKARKKGIQGKVFVSFVIDEEGKTTQVKIVKSVHPLLDDAAKEVIKKYEGWPSCGFCRGKPTKVQNIVPINFKLQ